MATNPYGINPSNPDEEALNRFLTSMFLGGRDPSQVEQGVKHSMDPSRGAALAGSGVSGYKDPLVRTFAPHEQATQEDVLKGLGEILLGAGLENLKATGPHAMEKGPAPSRGRMWRGNRPAPTDFSAPALDALKPEERSALLDRATPSELRYAEHSYAQRLAEARQRFGKVSPERIAADQAAAQAHEAARTAQQQQVQSLMDEVGPEGVSGARRHADRMSQIMRSIGVPGDQAHGDALLESLMLRAEEQRRNAGPPSIAPSEVDALIDNIRIGGGVAGTQPANTQEITRPLPADAPPVSMPETGFRLKTDTLGPVKPQLKPLGYGAEEVDLSALVDALPSQAQRPQIPSRPEGNPEFRSKLAIEGQRMADRILNAPVKKAAPPTLSGLLMDSFREVFGGKSKLKKP